MMAFMLYFFHTVGHFAQYIYSDRILYEQWVSLGNTRHTY